jgi:hypothetical protein
MSITRISIFVAFIAVVITVCHVIAKCIRKKKNSEIFE